MVNSSSPRIQLENHKSTTFPVEQTNQQVLKQLKEKITMGLYKVGDLIVSQEFQKVSVKGGKIANFFLQWQEILSRRDKVRAPA